MFNLYTECYTGEEYDPQPEEDWQEVKDISKGLWEDTINNLKRSMSDVINSLALLDEGILTENIPDKNYTFYTILHGLIQHDIYHAGQIAILKKALTDI